MIEINKIYNSSFEELLPRIDNGIIDLTITSPPYDGIRDYIDKPEWDYRFLGRELFRATKEGGIAALVIQDSSKDYAKTLTTNRLILDWCDNAGWKLFETIIYHRPGRPGNWWSRRFRVDHEYIPIFFKGKKPRFFNKESIKIPSNHAGGKTRYATRFTDGTLDPGDNEGKIIAETKCPGTVWNLFRSCQDPKDIRKIKCQHPASFSDMIPEKFISCFTQPGDLVFDPMAGSFTTAYVARLMDRKFIASDIATEYYNLGLQRLGLIEEDRVDANEMANRN